MWPFLYFSCPVYISHKNYWISKCFGQFDQLNKTMCRAQNSFKSIKANPSCDHFFVFHFCSITLTKVIEFLNAVAKLMNSTRQCVEHKFIQIHRVNPSCDHFFVFLLVFLCQLYKSHKNDWIPKCFGQYVQLNKTMCRAQHLSKYLSCDHFFGFFYMQYPVRSLTKMIEYQNYSTRRWIHIGQTHFVTVSFGLFTCNFLFTL